MEFFTVSFAGIIQGLTEFLPISSTGHLIIFEHIFNLSPQYFGLTFDASLHLGTLLAVVIFFRKEYFKILNPKNPLLVKLIIGTIPAVVAGYLFQNIIEDSARNLVIVGSALIIFSFVIYIADKFGKKNKNKEDITYFGAAVIGLFQSFALIPGVSRSGSTISAGLILGQKREEAAKFAFLLSGPIIAGAGGLKFLEVLSSSSVDYSLNVFLIGMTFSFFSGIFTIKYFLAYLQKRSLLPFIAYRIILGLTLLAFFI